MKLALLLVTLLLPPSDPPQSAPADQAAALRSTSLDDLIRQLPHVGREGAWDEKQDEYVWHPAVTELKRRFAAGERPSDAQWRAALHSTGAVRLRPKWPAATPIAVSMRIPGWLGVARITLDPEPAALNTVKAGRLISSWCGNCSIGDERRGLYQELGELPVGKHALGFTAEIEVGRPWGVERESDGLPTGIAWQGPLPWTVEIVPTLEDALPPVTSEKVDAAVRRSISVSFSNWGSGRSALLVLDPDVCANTCLAELALSIEVELLQGDAVIDSYSMFASDADRMLLSSSVSECDRQALDFRVLKSLPATLEQDDAARSGWRLRVRGTTKDILRAWDATSHWSGRIEIPLDEAIRNEIERAGSKGRGSWCWIPGPK